MNIHEKKANIAFNDRLMDNFFEDVFLDGKTIQGRVLLENIELGQMNDTQVTVDFFKSELLKAFELEAIRNKPLECRLGKFTVTRHLDLGERVKVFLKRSR